ncbi:MAG: CHASE3 domain-containing protein, partial [Fulvivirga sp.]|nr:CHASE3 domain-containing protein [Fulvivirga sp.]
MLNLRSFSILIVVIISFLLGISLITYINLNNYINNAKWNKHSSLILKELESILSMVKDAQTAHRGYELTGDSSFLDPYINKREFALQRTTALDSLLLGDEVQLARQDRLHELIKKQFNITDEILTRRKEDSGVDRYGMNLLIFDEENMTQIRKVVNNMITREYKLLDQRTSGGVNLSYIVPLLLLLSFISAVAALSYFILQLYKNIK